MARHVWRGGQCPDFKRCGIVATFCWAGWYEAPCARPVGHEGRHDDGISTERLLEPEPLDRLAAIYPGATPVQLAEIQARLFAHERGYDSNDGGKDR